MQTWLDKKLVCWSPFPSSNDTSCHINTKLKKHTHTTGSLLSLRLIDVYSCTEPSNVSDVRRCWMWKWETPTWVALVTKSWGLSHLEHLWFDKMYGWTVHLKFDLKNDDEFISTNANPHLVKKRTKMAKEPLFFFQNAVSGVSHSWSTVLVNSLRHQPKSATILTSKPSFWLSCNTKLNLQVKLHTFTNKQLHFRHPKMSVRWEIRCKLQSNMFVCQNPKWQHLSCQVRKSGMRTLHF